MGAISDITPLVRMFVPQCPEPAIEDAIRRAARIFCNETWYVRRNVEFDTVDGVGEYTINDATDLEVIAIKAAQLTQSNDSIIPLQPVPLGFAYPAYPTNQPYWYQFVPYNTMVVYPSANAAYTIRVTLIAQPTATADTLPDEIINKWDNGVAAGALAWLQNIPGQAWTNPGMAAQNERVFRSAISNAKAEVQRSYLPGAMRARGRAFVLGGL